MAGHEVRLDPVLGTVVHVVGGRQARPNLPVSGCPFCVGGLEAPEAYDVKSFANRWPAMPGERCEVVLYTSEHDATFWSLGADGARRVVDLWAERTVALGARDDVDYVLVFENRGAEVGATIAHPHGQIYAYDHVPSRQSRRLAGGWRPDERPGDRAIVEVDGWSAWVPFAPTFPISVELAPAELRTDLGSMDDVDRDGLAVMLVDVLARLDRLYDRPLAVHVVVEPATHRRVGTRMPGSTSRSCRRGERPASQRFVAAAEVASEEYFNPVVPEELAERLREV